MFSSPNHVPNPSLVVECVDPAHATMYLNQPLTADDAHELRRVAQVLPPRVRVLRVQVGAADANQHTMDALRDVVRAWRSRGNIHLVFVGGLPASRQQSGLDVTTAVAHLQWPSPAHTAAFL